MAETTPAEIPNTAHSGPSGETAINPSLLEEGESLTKEGFVEALSTKGVDETKVEKIFSKMAVKA